MTIVANLSKWLGRLHASRFAEALLQIVKSRIRAFGPHLASWGSAPLRIPGRGQLQSEKPSEVPAAPLSIK